MDKISQNCQISNSNAKKIIILRTGKNVLTLKGAAKTPLCVASSQASSITRQPLSDQGNGQNVFSPKGPGAETAGSTSITRQPLSDRSNGQNIMVSVPSLQISTHQSTGLSSYKQVLPKVVFTQNTVQQKIAQVPQSVPAATENNLASILKKSRQPLSDWSNGQNIMLSVPSLHSTHSSTGPSSFRQMLPKVVFAQNTDQQKIAQVPQSQIVKVPAATEKNLVTIIKKPQVSSPYQRQFINKAVPTSCVLESVVDDSYTEHLDDGLLIVARNNSECGAFHKDKDLLKARETFSRIQNSSEKNVSSAAELVLQQQSKHKSIDTSSPTPNNEDDIIVTKQKLSVPKVHYESDSDGALSDDFITKKKPSALKGKKEAAATSNKNNISDHEQVMKILPKNYDHKVLSAEISANEFNHIIANIRVNVSTQADALKWKADFEQACSSDFRVKKTWGDLGESKRVLFKRKYRCHHNTLAEKSGSKKAHDKHVQCPATMVLTVRKTEMKWSKDPLLKSHPCDVMLRYTHNHSIRGADILRFRRPAPEIVEKFTKMFTEPPYHTPTTAFDAHLADLEMDGELSFLTESGDGSKTPQMSWLYKLYNKLAIQQHGAPCGEGMIEALKEYVTAYNKQCGEVCAKMSEKDGHHFVAVCTPLMNRVHTHIKASAEVMFIDSSGSMDGANARMFMILTPSVVCGLPLGMLLTFSEKEEVVTAALDLWKSILPEKAFYGRGSKGPKLILTDDSTSERNSLRRTFPFAILLLCIFHVLQAMWRYVWDSKRGVKNDHRGEIYFAFHQMLYAPTTSEFEELYNDALENNETISSYSSIVKHFKDKKETANEWALCHRKDLLTRGHHTNNFCEAAMLLIKSRILDRIKAFNSVQLLHFLLDRLDNYYKRKISFVINNRADGSKKTRYTIHEDKIKPLVPEKISTEGNLFLVKNMKKNTKYVVDMDLEVCECPVGSSGAPCKHQFSVAKKIGVRSNQFLPYYDTSYKTVLFYVCFGHTQIPEGWFDTLKNMEASHINLDLIPEFLVQASADPNSFERSTDNSSDPVTTEASNDDDIEASTAELVDPNLQEQLNSSMQTELQTFINDLSRRVSSSDALKEPVSKFLNNYWKIVNRCDSESTLASALATFSKDQSKQKVLRRGQISVLPGTIARRKRRGGGKAAQKGGMPRDGTEHEYNEAKRKASTDSRYFLPVKKAKTPHSLSQCVLANTRLPK